MKFRRILTTMLSLSLVGLLSSPAQADSVTVSGDGATWTIDVRDVYFAYSQGHPYIALTVNASGTGGWWGSGRVYDSNGELVLKRDFHDGPSYLNEAPDGVHKERLHFLTWEIFGPGPSVSYSLQGFVTRDAGEVRIPFSVSFDVKWTHSTIKKLGEHRWQIRGVERWVPEYQPRVKLQRRAAGEWETVLWVNRCQCEFKKKSGNGIFKIPAQPKGLYRIVFPGNPAGFYGSTALTRHP